MTNLRLNKKVLLSTFQLLTYLFLVIFCFGQSEGDYRSVKTGNWNDAETWETYSGNTWIAATSPPGSANGVISIKSGHIITATIPISIDQTIIENGGTLKVNPSINVTIVDGPSFGLIVNGTIDNSGTLFPSKAESIQIYPTGIYIHSRSGGNLPPAIWDPSSTCIITGHTNTEIGGLGQVFGNFIWDCFLPGSLYYNFQIAGISIAGNFIINHTGAGTDVNSHYLEINQNRLVVGGNLEINGGILKVGFTGSNSIDIRGSLIINGGTLYLSSGEKTGTLNIGGDFSYNRGVITTSSKLGGFINFNGTKPQIYSAIPIIEDEINFTVSSGAILQMADNRTYIRGKGYFKLLEFATLGITSQYGIYRLDPSTTANRGNIQVSGQRTFDPKANYIYNGSTPQETGNALIFANNLTINNLNGVSFTQNVSISGALSLVNGQLTTSNSSLLTLEDGASAEGAKNESFVNGPIRKVGDDAFTFPIGKGNKYVPIAISAPLNAADAYTAEYFPFSDPTWNNITSPGLLEVSNSEYWDLKTSAVNSNVDVIINWNENNKSSSSGFTIDPRAITIAHFDGSSWNVHGGSGTGTITNGSVTWKGVSMFSPFTFGKIHVDDPLPVHFVNIKVYEKLNGVQVDFTNLTEEDILFYELERADDGKNFIAVKKLIPHKNNNGMSIYSVLDTSAMKGKFIYRIKAVENTGKVIFSNLVSIETGLRSSIMNVYAKNGQVFFQCNGLLKGKYRIEVFNTAGQKIAADQFHHDGGSLSKIIYFNITKTGVYYCTINGPVQMKKKFIVQ